QLRLWADATPGAAARADGSAAIRVHDRLHLRSEPEGSIYLPDPFRVLARVPAANGAGPRLHQHARTAGLAGAGHQPAAQWRAPAAGRDAAVLRRSVSHRSGERDG